MKSLIVYPVLAAVLLILNSLPVHSQCNQCSRLSPAGVQGIECDLCGCYLGPDPNFNFNTGGVRYKLRHFSGIEEKAQQTETDHSGHSHNSDETYNTYELWGRYYISPRLQLSASMPISYNSIGDETFSGAGDLQIQGRYQIFNTEVDGDTRFRNRLFLGGGFKFPTGSFNIEDDSGDIVPHFQPGTGSFDFLLLGTYFAKSGGLGIVLDAVYKVNTENRNNYIFGNQFNLNGAFTYDIIAGSATVIPFAGVYYETAPEDKSNGTEDPNSGGNALFGSFGIDLTAGMFALRINYQAPFTQSLNGEQPLNDYRLVAGASYSFGF